MDMEHVKGGQKMYSTRRTNIKKSKKKFHIFKAHSLFNSDFEYKIHLKIWLCHQSKLFESSWEDWLKIFKTEKIEITST